MPSEKLILTIVRHQKFGNILQPILVAVGKDAEWFEFIELARKNSSAFSRLSESDKQIILLAERYSDFALMKSYSREKISNDFLKKVTEGTISKYIRPFIEARHRDILRIAKSESTPIYIRNDVKKKNFHFHESLKTFTEKSKMLFLFSNAETFTYKTVVRNGEKTIQLYEQNHITLLSTLLLW